MSKNVRLGQVDNKCICSHMVPVYTVKKGLSFSRPQGQENHYPFLQCSVSPCAKIPRFFCGLKKTL
jgi:hypothetical protein